MQQRKEEPAFKTVIEISDVGLWRIHDDVARAVDNATVQELKLAANSIGHAKVASLVEALRHNVTVQVLWLAVSLSIGTTTPPLRS